MLFRLVFGSFPFVVFILLAWTFLSPGYLGTRGRAIGLAALLLCAAKFMCFAALGGKRGDFPAAEQLAGEVLSIPIYPESTTAMRQEVVGAIAAFMK